MIDTSVLLYYRAGILSITLFKIIENSENGHLSEFREVTVLSIKSCIFPKPLNQTNKTAKESYNEKYYENDDV